MQNPNRRGERELKLSTSPSSYYEHNQGPISMVWKVSGKGKILPLIPEDDERLTTACEPFDFSEFNSAGIEQLYFDMVDTMRYNKGLGLSANQVGLKRRLFVMETGQQHPEAFFNPRIVETSDEVVLMEEGCLSFPDLLVKVKRPKKVSVRYQLIDGSWVTKQFVGLSARCVLHEMDHLDGKTMKDAASPLQWDLAQKRRRKVRKHA